MRKYFIASGIVFVAALSLTSAVFAQTAAKPAASDKPFDPHDLSGVWTRAKGLDTMGTDGIPWTAAGKSKFDADKPSYGPRNVPSALGNDPMGTCDPLGLPRELFLETMRPLEFAHLPDRVLQFFGWQHQFRTIWMDGRELPKDPDPRWDGYAVGRWDGDTFVVDSLGFDTRTWLDKFGDGHSDQLRVQERYKRIDHNTIEMTMTFTDPVFLSKPWTSDTKVLRLNKERGMDDKDETFCVPSEEQAFNKRVRDRAAGLP
jgi:hypothetical protein